MADLLQKCNVAEFLVTEVFPICLVKAKYKGTKTRLAWFFKIK